MVANFIKRGTKTGGTGTVAKAAHRIVTLFYCPMVLLNAVVQILTGAVQYFATQHTPDGTRIHGLLDPTCVAGQHAVAVFSPAAVAVHLTPPTGSPRNHLAVTITELEPRGEVIRVHAADSTGGTGDLIADITAAAAADLDLVPGKDVHFAIKATEMRIYPAR